MPETCGICGETVPFDATVHTVIHIHSEAGVLDVYVCRPCYEERLGPMFERVDTQEQSP
ncbi:hypothetical protein [Haloarcula japonica]|uniref:Small CPxCG-related zinc finger protein n=1 Tax=Haloarcula japonica (strain ATCC 49778 / DSM 6131 / JCM 7785 / NBRC 101032 / NCIMB 13157 / TR-1) TaxID=1227453 RepID=M0L715_HALJT|nr:hypothetical protein [Haloarcula japonica]EMA28888.1 hypothetical protein C444_16028 [Haloarcula japonica DSM 6131]